MQRICFLLKVKPDRLAEYKERHAHVWPDMLAALHQTGWLTIIGLVAALSLGAGVLMATIAFSAQRYFEYQAETLRAPGG